MRTPVTDSSIDTAPPQACKQWARGFEKILPGADGTWAIGISAAAFPLIPQGQGLAYVPLFPLGTALGFLAHRSGLVHFRQNAT